MAGCVSQLQESASGSHHASTPPDTAFHHVSQNPVLNDVFDRVAESPDTLRACLGVRLDCLTGGGDPSVKVGGNAPPAVNLKIPDSHSYTSNMFQRALSRLFL